MLSLKQVLYYNFNYFIILNFSSIVEFLEMESQQRKVEKAEKRLNDEEKALETETYKRDGKCNMSNYDIQLFAILL